MKKWFVKAVLLLPLIGASPLTEDRRIAAEPVHTVWIAPTGMKYHREKCRTVRGEKREIALAEAKRRGYEPCKVCRPGE